MHNEFQEMLSGFRQFLKQQSLSDNIIWVAPEHTICLKGQWLVYRGEGVEEASIKFAFEQTRQAAHGVCMHAICHNTENTWCALHTPVDQEQEAYQPLANGNVRFSVASQSGNSNSRHSNPIARLITRNILSHWYEWRGRHYHDIKLCHFGP